MRSLALLVSPPSLALLIATIACNACDSPSSGGPLPMGTSSSIAPVASSASAAPSTSASAILPPLPQPRLACRVLGPSPPSSPSTLADFKWLDVTPARITSKDPKSARETGFEGPARVRICVEGEEETWFAPALLVAGVDAGAGLAKFLSVRGAGEAPGAEEWVMTPLGVVRYSAAMVRVTVTPTRAAIELTSGTIDVWAADDAKMNNERAGGDAGAAAARAADAGPPAAPRADEGWQRYDGASAASLTTTASTLTEAAAKISVDKCVAAGAKARALGAQIAAPDASLATLAPQHVVARRLARAACGVARVRTSLLADSPSAVALAKAAVAADAAWRELRD